jgi:cell division protein FtsB
VELESRINYLEVHIEELKVENKQLEVDIAQTRVENGVLRTNLHKTRQSISNSKRPASPMLLQPNSVLSQQMQDQPVLLKDLLMLYGPHTGNDIR